MNIWIPQDVGALRDYVAWITFKMPAFLGPYGENYNTEDIIDSAIKGVHNSSDSLSSSDKDFLIENLQLALNLMKHEKIGEAKEVMVRLDRFMSKFELH